MAVMDIAGAFSGCCACSFALASRGGASPGVGRGTRNPPGNGSENSGGCVLEGYGSGFSLSESGLLDDAVFEIVVRNLGGILQNTVRDWWRG